MHQAEGVVLLKIHAIKVKDTVMAGEMVGSTMEIVAAQGILFVEATIVCSLVTTIMRKMTVVSNLLQVDGLRKIALLKLSSFGSIGCGSFSSVLYSTTFTAPMDLGPSRCS